MPKKNISLNQADIQLLDGTPYSTQFDDIYFSKNNGLEETHYVFLEQNNLAQRWSRLDPNKRGAFIIAETGFGTGLNFLACWQLWQQTAPSSWQLFFLSVEKYPLSLQQLSQCLSRQPQLTHYAKRLVKSYPVSVPGLHSLQFAQVNLHLYIGDVQQALTQWLSYHPDNKTQCINQSSCAQIDAWFLDGFSPAKNPDMWTDTLYQHMAILSKPTTSFATFTCAGHVRRGLEKVGFTTTKVAGFNRKREMLIGQLTTKNIDANWFIRPKHNNWYCDQRAPQQSNLHDKTALVIGAGIAGCHTAAALANNGWKVSIVDSANTFAQGASGNRQSILYTRLSWPGNRLTQFNLCALQYAMRFYQDFFASNDHAINMGSLSGVLQLAYNKKETIRLKSIVDAFSNNPSFCQWLDSKTASDIAGIELQHPGLFFPHAGWINPENLCRKLLSHPSISFLAETTIDSLQSDGTQWHAKIQQSDQPIKTDIVIICNAQAARNIAQCEYLPIKNIRGQVSHIRSSHISQELKVSVCHQGYIAPVFHKYHDVGATFTLHENTADILAADHQQNINQLVQHLPKLGNNLAPSDIAQGKTGFRCVTPDYLPIVGQVTNIEKLLYQFAGLRKHAKKIISSDAISLPGLYINIAHGSRGLSSTPIAAAHIANLVDGMPSPLSETMKSELHPARFLIRDLKRNKR